MPTKRVWILLILAAALYFLANQTQVGWVYVITDGIIGLLLVAFIYSRGMLEPVQARRVWRNPAPTTNSSASGGGEQNLLRAPAAEEFDEVELAPPTFHEDDPIEVTLQFSQTGLKPALLVSGAETCPFAPATEQNQSFFIPNLFKNQPMTLSYQTTCHRRGLYTFPDLQLRSGGPFGLFRTRRTLTLPDQILIYPQYFPLKRLRLLERRGVTERQSLRTGLSSDIMGTREYRSGDSLRQIHWRSTAHVGRLVVKEFADTDQLTLTVVLDLEAGSNLGRGKFSTFETAIRIAASLGYYASHKNIPFYLVGAGQQRELPRTPLSWWATLNYLAKVQNDGQESLANVLGHLSAVPWVVVLVTKPSQAIIKALQALSHRGSHTLAIFLTPAGASPEIPPMPQSTDFEIRTVDPYNWVELLTSL